MQQASSGSRFLLANSTRIRVLAGRAQWISSPSRQVLGHPVLLVDSKKIHEHGPASNTLQSGMQRLSPQGSACPTWRQGPPIWQLAEALFSCLAKCWSLLPSAGPQSLDFVWGENVFQCAAVFLGALWHGRAPLGRTQMLCCGKWNLFHLNFAWVLARSRAPQGPLAAPGLPAQGWLAWKNIAESAGSFPEVSVSRCREVAVSFCLHLRRFACRLPAYCRVA